MHVRLEHLLSLRDGEPVAAQVHEHVRACGECTAELARLQALRSRLRALPPAPAGASDGFATVLARRARRERQASRGARAAKFAVAASLGVIAVAIGWRMTDPAAPGGEGHRAMAVATDPQPAARDSAPSAPAAADRIAALQVQSAELEAALAAIGHGPSRERAGLAVPIDSLEAHVQWLDHLLLASDDATAVEPLWRERVATLDSLLRLRYVDAQRVALM